MNRREEFEQDMLSFLEIAACFDEPTARDVIRGYVRISRDIVNHTHRLSEIDKAVKKALKPRDEAKLDALKAETEDIQTKLHDIEHRQIQELLRQLFESIQDPAARKALEKLSNKMLNASKGSGLNVKDEQPLSDDAGESMWDD